MDRSGNLLTVADDLSAQFNLLYRDLKVYADVLSDRLNRLSTSHSVGPFDNTMVTRMRMHALGVLKRHSMLAGTGVIFAPERIAVPEQLIQWYVRSDDGDIEPYGFVYDRDSHEFYDFLNLPWYHTPRTTGRPALGGPLLDYLGFDEYIVTLAVPLNVGDEFAAVVGADILVESVQVALQKALSRHSSGQWPPVALVTEEDRIVCSNSARFLPGLRLNEHSDGLSRITLATSVPTFTLVAATQE
ncbi:cache domain-containing protein [Kocuria sp. cx-455]|uniref:cache domain-containing protein n=1 Tax=Kocuria sp. cx-455 TaxID=2771377 RepID=UPI003D70FBCC